jgi:hypothetical protein
VTRIGAPIKAVADYTKDCYYTVYVVDAQPRAVSRTLQVVIPAYRFSQNTVNQWVYIDVEIELSENQTLGFSSGGDTVDLGYSVIIPEVGGFITGDDRIHQEYSIPFDVIVE